MFRSEELQHCAARLILLGQANQEWDGRGREKTNSDGIFDRESGSKEITLKT